MPHVAGVTSVKFSPDGRQLLTIIDYDTTLGAGKDNILTRSVVTVWDAATGRRIGEPIENEAGFNSAQFSPDGRRLVTASQDGTAQVWDAAPGKEIGKPIVHEATAMPYRYLPPQYEGEPPMMESSVFSAWFSPDGRLIEGPEIIEEPPRR